MNKLLTGLSRHIFHKPRALALSYTASSPVSRRLAPNTNISIHTFGYVYRTMSETQTDDKWKAVLSPEQFRVLRQRGTEAPGTGKYIQTKDTGVYNCGACDTPLYVSTTKFDSGCGWPAFFDAIPGAITRIEDRSHGMARTEIVCTNCQSHMGHVFKGEGFSTPTDERHCVNSISLNFRPKSKADDNDNSME